MTSVTFDLDRYYTPEDVARLAFEKCDFDATPRSCVDSSCGTGRLLDAVNEAFGEVTTIGVDRDANAIRALRRRRPNWLLAKGDLLCKKSFSNGFGRIVPRSVDLLVLNPPFSQVANKHLEFTYEGSSLRGSLAMTYLFRSLEIFAPKVGALAVVPESLVWSETDAGARATLLNEFRYREIASLKCNTFRGARANATIIELNRWNGPAAPRYVPQRPETPIWARVQLVRGAMPVHMANYSTEGVCFLHTTDIRKMLVPHGISALRRVSHVAKGLVAGWTILLPRVGMPDATLVRAIFLREKVQLSDCVFAICCPRVDVAEAVAALIQSKWDDALGAVHI